MPIVIVVMSVVLMMSVVRGFEAGMMAGQG
jgi:hypothetical protein